MDFMPQFKETSAYDDPIYKLKIFNGYKPCSNGARFGLSLVSTTNLVPRRFLGPELYLRGVQQPFFFQS